MSYEEMERRWGAVIAQYIAQEIERADRLIRTVDSEKYKNALKWAPKSLALDLGVVVSS